MDNKKDESYYNLRGLFKYISTVVTWTIFVLLIIIGVLLIYYYVSVKLYATKGDKFEPKFSVYNIVSISMEPTIKKYDVIINTKIDSIDDVKVNDVITFISTWNINYGMTVTHRVVDTKVLDDGSKCLVTRGDNNTLEDQSCVKEGEIIGVVKAVIPSLGKVQFFLSSALGWLLIVIVPALYIIVKDIIKIIKLAKDSKNEKNANKNKKNVKKDNLKIEDKDKKNEIKEEKISKVDKNSKIKEEEIEEDNKKDIEKEDDDKEVISKEEKGFFKSLFAKSKEEKEPVKEKSKDELKEKIEEEAKEENSDLNDNEIVEITSDENKDDKLEDTDIILIKETKDDEITEEDLPKEKGFFKNLFNSNKNDEELKEKEDSKNEVEENEITIEEEDNENTESEIELPMVRKSSIEIEETEEEEAKEEEKSESTNKTKNNDDNDKKEIHYNTENKKLIKAYDELLKVKNKVNCTSKSN